MREGQATAIFRDAYSAPAFWIDTVDLTFDLDPAKTRVLNKMRLRRNPEVAAQALRLDGEDLNLARGKSKSQITCGTGNRHLQWHAFTRDGVEAAGVVLG